MSHGQRLSRLEASLAARPSDRGSHCGECGGLTIEDAILADVAVARNDWAEVDEVCRRCGAQTLVGALAEDCTG
jgi:hypothetical protein